MTINACDFAFSPAGYIESLPGLGVQALGRYAPYAGDGGKGLTSAEYQRIKDAGLRLWLYQQVYGTESKQGYDAGVTQAHLALGAHNLVPELPKTIAFYFASDYKVTDTTAQVAHFKGINSVLPVERIGVYGNTQLINALYAERLITYSCLAGAASWSDGRPTRLTMEQFPSTYFHGNSIDPVTIYEEDFGEGDEMTPEEIKKLVDDAISAQFRTLTRQYWDRQAEGAYSKPPDPEVVAGIAAALPSSSVGVDTSAFIRRGEPIRFESDTDTVILDTKGLAFISKGD